ncbi:MULTISPECIES: histone-like nucleoid-structuring protein Lsr2 [Streptomyces]|uniref:Histone-like nucleoid-structuring protein Lsr2 n=1 Tax=Streptomyces flaveolus TaxID=67297 RepID=A0ABV3AEE9_9ACTN|nr:MULTISPECIES: histone-like nucleoid-structuring protein Lsr2 [Streptomyces]
MFTYMKEALAAEDLELTPLGDGQNAAASLAVAHHSRDKADLIDLLGALGLPCGEDDLVRLLPHLTTPDDSPTGVTMPTGTVNAFIATAVSMLNNGDSPEHVRGTLGLSQDELTEALRHAEAVRHAGLPASGADTGAGTGIPETAAAPDSTMDADGIEALLAWAENHPAASIRNRAARVRSDLAELTERRADDEAQRQAEERVAKAKAELEAAQAQLRAVKAGGHTATAVQAAPRLAPAPDPAAPTGKRSKEELAAIRTWARANGYQVADRGNPAKVVIDAYDAAHRTTNLAEAS